MAVLIDSASNRADTACAENRLWWPRRRHKRRLRAPADRAGSDSSEEKASSREPAAEERGVPLRSKSPQHANRRCANRLFLSAVERPARPRLLREVRK